MRKKVQKKITIYILISVGILFVGFSMFYFSPYILGSDIEEVVIVETRDEYIEIGEEITGKSGIVYDITNDDILIGKNIKSTFPTASITKLISTMVASQLLTPTDRAVLDNVDFELPDHNPIRANEYWLAKDLLEYSLITSSNRGISAISRLIEEKTAVPFIASMNEFLQKNGIFSTHFINSTGLDIHDGLEGSSSSVEDTALILDIFLTKLPELAEATTQEQKTFTTIDGYVYKAQNTNHDIEITDQLLLSKTGYTDVAGGTLAIVIEMNNGNRIAIVVLGSTKEGRFDDVQKLISLAKNLLEL